MSQPGTSPFDICDAATAASDRLDAEVDAILAAPPEPEPRLSDVSPAHWVHPDASGSGRFCAVLRPPSLAAMLTPREARELALRLLGAANEHEREHPA